MKFNVNNVMIVEGSYYSYLKKAHLQTNNMEASWTGNDDENEQWRICEVGGFLPPSCRFPPHNFDIIHLYFYVDYVSKKKKNEKGH